MKRTTFLIILIAFILGSAMVCLAQMEGKMGKEMYRPMMWGMHGMMGKKLIATDDGGVVVMWCNKLYKYDKDLNLKKEVEIPVDMEHIKKLRMKMKEMRMLEESTGKP